MCKMLNDNILILVRREQNWAFDVITVVFLRNLRFTRYK